MKMSRDGIVVGETIAEAALADPRNADLHGKTKPSVPPGATKGDGKEETLLKGLDRLLEDRAG